MDNLHLQEFMNNNNHQWNIPNTVPPNLWDTHWPWAPIIPEFEIDNNKILSEMKSIDNLFVPHRDKDKIKSYGHQGWNSITLHGIDYDKTEHYDKYGFKSQEEANYKWTPICDQIPYTVHIIKQLPFFNYGRVRIMRLDPGGWIMPHNDGKGRIFGPFNFALNNPENCQFVFKDWGKVPFRPGIGFILDIGNIHAIHNNSNEARYHVIIHGQPHQNINNIIQQSIPKL